MRPTSNKPLTHSAAAFRCMLALLVILYGLLAAASTAGAQDSPGADSGEAYRLNPGDRINVSVFNQEDLSGEFVVDGSGRIFMPLIGQVDAAGMTATELETELVGRYKPDYLVNPRITVQIELFRPYYMMGEVQSQGPFEYVEGMTFLEAIARAGGYTYRARKDVVYVVRSGENTDEIRLDVNERIQPGDIIRVAERIF